jgi:general secretion pathway protein L
MREPITIDLGAPAKASDLPAMAGRFFVWWGGELRTLLPWQQETVSMPRQATLYARADRWFLRPGPDAAAVPLDTSLSDADLAEHILHAANGAPLSRLQLLLPREFVITRRLELPQMTLANARQAVELQVDRLSPFKADAVRTAARIAGYDAEKGAMHVDVAIVPLVRVRPVEQRLRALGLTPAGVDVEGDNGVGQGFALGEPLGADDVRRGRVLNAGLATAAAVVWALAVSAWGQAGEGDIRSWEARVAALRPAAERGAALRQDLEGMIVPIARANAHDPAAVLNVLEQLTHLLPDNVRVLDLKIEGNAVQLSGIAESAPDLIGVLENATSFKNAKFVSPVVRSSGTGVERFEIAMQLEGAAP